MKVLINNSYGGFGISFYAAEEYAKRKGLVAHFQKYGSNQEISFQEAREAKYGVFFWFSTPSGQEVNSPSRYDATLIQIVEELGEKANGSAANLSVEEIPDGTAFIINEYDGMESICYRDDIPWIIAGGDLVE